MSQRLEDYAMIGDCQSAALIGRDGSLDWLCWPRFDSPACFARLLGDVDNGRWLIAAKAEKADSVKITRRYRHNTLILETIYETPTGRAMVIDFMPASRPHCHLVRIVRGLSGKVAFHTELTIRPNYGVAIPWVRHDKNGDLHAVVGPDALVLRSEVDLTPHGRCHRADFEVEADRCLDFVLTYHQSYADRPERIDARDMLEKTERRWHQWTGHFTAKVPHVDLVLRSLITLRALIYEVSGAIVAAPTTSLPEALGGERNWDYRYCWLRDATFTLFALMNGGYTKEAKNWREWLLRAVGGDPNQIQIMYGLGGEQRIPEFSLSKLAGYEGSRPVRVGNAAASQLQIDIYGELLDALYQARKHGLTPNGDDWMLQIELLRHLSSVWRKRDQGIWEMRGDPQHFVYSKVMAWVAFDRAIKTVEEYGLEGPVDDWRRERDAIHAQVCAQGWNEEIGAFTQAYGSTKLDASALLIPLTGFLRPDDPRIRRTLDAIERHLMKDGLVRRYIPDGNDGLKGEEGAFIACSFWFVDNLVLVGRYDDACAMFDRLAGLATDLGFLSEEYDIENRRLIGNFPQAFSHIALINSAFNLARAHSPAEERSGQKSDAATASAM